MKRLGKNLVLSLCLVATLLVILGLKRKFGGADETSLLSQPSGETFEVATSTTTRSPQPRVLQAKPATQQDQDILSPTRSPSSESNAERTQVNRPASPYSVEPYSSAPSSPIPLNQQSTSPQGAPPQLIPVSEPMTTSIADGVTGNVGDESPIGSSPAELPSAAPRPVPETKRPLPEFVITGPEDSFWSISEKIYGSGTYYRALFRHNEGQVLRPDQIRAGIEVRTPPLTMLKQLYPADYPSEASPAH